MPYANSQVRRGPACGAQSRSARGELKIRRSSRAGCPGLFADLASFVYFLFKWNWYVNIWRMRLQIVLNLRCEWENIDENDLGYFFKNRQIKNHKVKNILEACKSRKNVPRTSQKSSYKTLKILIAPCEKLKTFVKPDVKRKNRSKPDKTSKNMMKPCKTFKNFTKTSSHKVPLWSPLRFLQNLIRPSRMLWNLTRP